MRRRLWWKRAAAAGLIGQQVPVVVGALWLLAAAVRLGTDDFLLFIGFLFIILAAFAVGIAASCAAWAWVFAARALRDDGHARWHVAGFGVVGTLITANSVFIVGAVAHPLLLLFGLASVANLALAAYAPLAGSGGSDLGRPARRRAFTL